MQSQACAGVCGGNHVLPNYNRETLLEKNWLELSTFRSIAFTDRNWAGNIYALTSASKNVILGVILWSAGRVDRNKSQYQVWNLTTLPVLTVKLASNYMHVLKQNNGSIWPPITYGNGQV